MDTDLFPIYFETSFLMDNAAVELSDKKRKQEIAANSSKLLNSITFSTMSAAYF
jgi:hypothetical protein